MTSPRLATADDVAAIARLHCVSFPEGLGAQLGPAWIAADYRRRLESPTGRLYVVPRAGFLAATLFPASPLPEGEGWRMGRRRPGPSVGASTPTTTAAVGHGQPEGVLGRPPVGAALRPWAAALAHLLQTGRLPAWLGAAAALGLHELRGRGAPARGSDAASIDYVAVDVGHRGRGVGGALVEAALDDPAAVGRRWIVGTEADNVAALTLYAGHGFEPRERWRGYDGRTYVRLHRRPKR